MRSGLLLGYRRRILRRKKMNLQQVESAIQVLESVRQGLLRLHTPRQNKQDSVVSALSDPRWFVWSDSEIARHCGVSQPMVAKYRKRLPVAQVLDPDRKVRRNGKVYILRVNQLGRKSKRR